MKLLLSSVLAVVVAASAPLGTLRGKEMTGVCDDVQQYAGYFDIDTTTNKNYFYWAFESRGDPAKDPVILWMTGGPGCSSEIALFAENGPCSVNHNLTTVKNPSSWNEAATLIYIDQPAGVGYSYADKDGFDHDETGVGDDMYAFLQAFYTAYPKFQDTDLFIFGESYAGHYVPAVTHRVFKGNQNKEGLPLPLAGMSVGNGLTDPEVQYAYYPEFTYNYTQERLGKPVISLATYEKMKAAVPACIEKIHKCQTGSQLMCKLAQSTCNAAMLSPYQQTGLNTYDIRVPCGDNPLCYDFSAVEGFLALEATRTYLGVNPDITWQSCNYAVNADFGGDWMKNYQMQIPDLLANGIRVLIYAGDCDFVCNWIGNKAWTMVMEWPHKADFVAAPDTAWAVVGDDEAGIARTASNFTFLQVHNAGHMVPMDQPENALTMVKMFLANKPF